MAWVVAWMDDVVFWFIILWSA